MDRNVHHGHEKNAGREADDDPPLLIRKVLLSQLSFLFRCLFRLLSGNSYELVARVEDGLLHILQADHPGIVGNVGLLRRQVYLHLNHAIQLSQSRFYGSHAHGTGHAPYLEHSLLIDNIVT